MVIRLLQFPHLFLRRFELACVSREQREIGSEDHSLGQDAYSLPHFTHRLTHVSQSRETDRALVVCRRVCGVLGEHLAICLHALLIVTDQAVIIAAGDNPFAFRHRGNVIERLAGILLGIL